MEQHPVPQHISSYEFHLVGDMTLKQFFQLAAGVIIALLFYASPLPGIIKWPLAFFSTLLGIALAFLPFEERPLSSWIIAFFKAIYSPTQFVWQKQAPPPSYFKPEPPGQESQPEEAYLASVPQSQEESIFEQAERAFLTRVNSLFRAQPQQQAQEPEVVTVYQNIPAVSQSAPPQPKPTPQPTPEPQPQQQPSAPRPELQVPVVEPIKVEEDASQQQEAKQQEEKSKTQPQATVSPSLVGQQVSPPAAQQAQFTPEAAPPAPLDTPNTIVGQVLTASGKIIEGAILEIVDENNLPVRALKSNKLGHFMSVTPLKDGGYMIHVEKEGFTFEPVKFTAKGEPSEPILITAKEAQSANDQTGPSTTT